MSTDSLTLPADAPSTTDVSEFSEAEGSENSEVPDVQTQLRALRRELEHEKHRNTQLTAQLKRQTQLQGRLQLQAEQEEEYITNKLMKRLEALKQEKEDLARQVEVEEEMITNALTKKLQKVKEEKIHLENQLEQEQEYIVNKLQKQLSTVLDEKRALETRLRENTGAILQSIQQHLQRWTTGEAPAAAASTDVAGPSSDVSSASASAGVAEDPHPHACEWTPIRAGTGDEAHDEADRTHLLVSHLTHEIDRLGAQQERYRRECEAQIRGNETLRQELSKLQSENAGLSHRVAREREIRAAAILDHARLATEIELDSERAFNSSTLSSVTSSPALSSSLPPVWALPSPRGLTPSLTPAVLSPRAGSPRPSVIFSASAPQSVAGTPHRPHSPPVPRTPLSPRTPLDGTSPERAERTTSV
mmetsp:Transcript_51542/g.102579  ORF Transcript_51542/g.102579 Transcript_51542/m.102579 type:complete len:418 (-) Transcript_51542:380-1633(-)